MMNKKHMFKKPYTSLTADVKRLGEISHGFSINGAPLAIYVTNVYDFWRKGYDGNGVIVGVIDDGVDKTHPALLHCPDKSKKILGEFTYVTGGRVATKKPEHGTAVAGLISGWQDAGYKGMAPGSKIYSFNVFDTDGEADSNDIVTAVHKAIELGCHVINMSLGSTQPSDRLKNVVKRAWNFNIPCICAAGNEGPDTVLYPAAYPECISVGSVKYNYTNGTIIESSFSSTNPEVDCCAVGENVLVLDATTKKYMVDHGTSFSTPIVSGFVVLLRQYLINKNLHVLTVDKIKNVLYSNTLDLFTIGRDNRSGVGLVFRRGIKDSPITVKTFGS